MTSEGSSGHARDLGVTPVWETLLSQQLPVFGHRNWIVVSDAAYPAQSNPGIETIFVAGEPTGVIRKTLAQVSACGHLRANIYVDEELEYVSESDAPGITRYREELAALLPSEKCQALPHEQLIARLDQCARTFRVLIVKTELALPYTSIFLELTCGYWSDAAEGKLRKNYAARSR